ncbi:MAG TPA: DUF4412 domain-containing protein [Bacteroidota bacterium]|nr:DUF4412 domain-containing protein [Bacteroidota bacterium]
MIRLLVCLVALCGTARAQFEGFVETRNTTTDETGVQQQYVMTMWVKNSMARITSSATGSSPATTMIYRSDKKIIWMLNDDDKTYFEITQDKNPDQSSPQPDKPVVRLTHKTRKILGYPCEQVLISQSDLQTEIWATKSLGGLSTALARGLGQEQSGAEGGWNDELTKMGLFPLLVSTRSDGKIVESQEIVKIEKKSLSEDLFLLPSNYTRQTVDHILK